MRRSTPNCGHSVLRPAGLFRADFVAEVANGRGKLRLGAELDP
jgi:hypothetical protein